MPYWYTTFYEHYRTGDPVIRPLVYEFPNDRNVLDIDDQWLIASNILVSPVIKKDATTRTIYLPGGYEELWYNTELSLLYYGGNYDINVDNNTNLYFYRGGTIIARRDAVKQTANESLNDPLNLYVFLNSSNIAAGTLYVDDGNSFNYRNKQYIYREYLYVNETLSFSNIDSNAIYNGNVTIESIIIYRPPSNFKLMSTQKVKPDVKVVFPEHM